jgi:hypothetical protein
MAGKKITDLTDYPGGVFANTNEMEMSVDIGASVFVSRKVSWSDILASITSLSTNIQVACSDETTALTTGTEKMTFRMPHGMTLTEVRCSVTTAPTGSVLTVDINDSGATILSTKLTIDIGEKTSTTSAIPPVINQISLSDDVEITIDIDTIGSTIAGAGLKVTLIGTKI